MVPGVGTGIGTRFLSPNASAGITGASGADAAGDLVIKRGRTFLTLDQMKIITGGVHTYDYASANGVGLDGGGKSVYAVEFPASSKLTGKWAVKVWDGDPIDSKERLENELVARVVAKHMCNHPNLNFTKAYGSDDGKGSYIIASKFLEGYKEVEAAPTVLSKSTNFNLRAQLYAFGEIAPLDQFHTNGIKYNGDNNSTVFGLYDLEIFNWRNDSTTQVPEPGKNASTKTICTFSRLSKDPQFGIELQSVVSGWKTKINNPTFQRSLSEEFQSKVGLSVAEADQIVRVLHRRTSVFAVHVGLTP